MIIISIGLFIFYHILQLFPLQDLYISFTAKKDPLSLDLQLFKAVNHCDIQATKKALNNGANSNIKYFLFDGGQKKVLSTPLITITHFPSLDAPAIALLLITKGAFVDTPTYRGETALICAACCNNQYSSKMVEIFLAHGANIHKKNLHRETALHMAAKCNSTQAFKVMQTLLNAGAHADNRITLIKKMPHSLLFDLILAGAKIPGKKELAKFSKPQQRIIKLAQNILNNTNQDNVLSKALKNVRIAHDESLISFFKGMNNKYGFNFYTNSVIYEFIAPSSQFIISQLKPIEDEYNRLKTL